MSIEQVESAILELRPDERQRLLLWLDEHRHDLFSPVDADEDLSDAQKAELLRRRREYDEHPERFQRMDGPALDAMFSRIRAHVAARLPSTR